MNRRVFLQASGATALLQGVLGGLSMEALASEPEGRIESRLSALSARIERLQSRAPVPIVARGLEAQGIPVDALTNLLAGMSVAQVWHDSSAAEQAHPGWEPILEATMAPFARDLGTVLSTLEARPQARPSRRWRRHPERLKRVIERALPGDGELFSELEPPCAFDLTEWDAGDPVVALREHYDRAAEAVDPSDPGWALASDSDSSSNGDRAIAAALKVLGVSLLLVSASCLVGFVGMAVSGFAGAALPLLVVGLLLLWGAVSLFKTANRLMRGTRSASSPADHEDWTADDWLFVEEVELFMAA
jgi:hypothetical protein